MRGIKPFDPWKSKLCTCPEKFVVNPYTGCGHRCLYCYASSYIRNFHMPRPKEGIVEAVRKDAEKMPPGIVMVSASTDPYQPLEERFELTRQILQILAEKRWKIELVTKGTLFLRDKDILKKANVVLSVTVTTMDEELARRLEPFAPSPKERIYAMKKMKVPKVLRIDPLIPSITMAEENVAEVLKAAKKAKVSHVVFSTYKARKDSLQRLCNAFPEKCQTLRKLYSKGAKISNYIYLPYRLRLKVLKHVEKMALKMGFTVGFCREGIAFSAPSCDGSHLFTSGALSQ